MSAVWFRPDNMRAEYDQAEPYKALHIAAAAHGFIFKVERSNITRGWTYNSNIFRVEPTGTFYADAPHLERNRYIPMGAGSGLDPIQSLIHGVRLCRIDSDPLIAALILECEVWLLTRAYRLANEREKAKAALAEKLMLTLDTLTNLIRSVNVPGTGIVVNANVDPFAARYDEDDDL